MFETERIMEQLHLFWQYPVITEKTFYDQERRNPDYAGLPWATIVDKKYSLNVIYNLLPFIVFLSIIVILTCF